MDVLSRRAIVFALAGLPLVGQFTIAPRAALSAPAPSHPPARIPIPEPPRRTPPPMPLAHATRAPISHDIHPAHGSPGHPPPMLRPSEIDRVLSAARRRAALAMPERPHIAQSVTSRPLSAGATRGGFAPGKPGARARQSLSSASGTGINPWWRYAEQNITGVGHAMVNVGTGNLVLQSDDMSVPHKGMTLAFRLTYNSQSQHDVAGTDGAVASMYGNGWTNTFDAHISGSSTGTISVWDIDGARYDYTLAADGVTRLAPPGQYATLTPDGTGCGYLWTKKSGTTYYFWTPDGAGSCPSWWNPSYAAYAGRLYQLIGRNRNTYITFNYSWDNGISAAGGKISQITAQTESGLTATLVFADVSGNRLLQQLIFPDGVTSVNYYYYANGDLGNIQRPANNAAGYRPLVGFGYQALGTGTVLWNASSPRWCASPCGTDGAWTRFDFVVSDHASAALSGIGYGAVVNMTIPDGSNQTVLQPGYTTAATGYLMQYFTTGVSTPTFRDTDGHAINWVVDSLGRPTQTQECTATTNGSCTGTWLVANETWDSVNNLASEVDPRGNETDYLYDPMGNTTAVGEPLTTTSQGTIRPTKIYDYDTFNNVVAYCDANEAHAANADWTPISYTVKANDSLCASQVGSAPHWRATYTYPSYEPNGELATMISPSGYTRTLSYAASQESGNDYGLPTAVTGDQITQNDASTPIRQPNQSLWYDASGNLVCYGTGNGQWLLTYDALGRVTSTADPDDSSAGTGVCAKTGAQANWNTVTRTSYFADGSVASKQTASQVANGVSTSFTYDADGDPITETHHYGCTSISSCTAGVTQKFYDGADRLVEVLQPWDGWDVQSYPWATRYIYDLSQGGTTAYHGMGLVGHGNLVSTQELLSGTVWQPNLQTTYGIGTGTWTDVRATAFDALDRGVNSYEAAFGNQPKERRAYDVSGQEGLLSSVTLVTNEVKQYTYDGMGRQTATTYSGGANITPGVHLTLDADGRIVASSTDTLGAETMQYDATGNLVSVVEPASLGGSTISYDYYPDGLRQDVKYSGSGVSYQPLLQYGYRNDGRPERLQLNNGTAFQWTYTAAGRELSQSDPLTGTTIHPDAAYPVGQNRQAGYYPASMAYVARVMAYDSYGRLSHLALPEALGSSMSYDYSASQYDLEDSPIAETRNRYSQSTLGVGSNVAVQACLPTTIRNEKMPVPGTPNCSSVVPTHQTYNGTLMADVKAYDPASTPAWLLDARAGMLLNDQYTSPRSGNLINAAYIHDASGRLTQDSEAKEPTCPAGDPYAGSNLNAYCFSNGTRQKTYDAENRLVADVYSYADPTTPTTTSYGVSSVGGYWAQGYQPASIQAVDYNGASHPVRLALYHPDYGGAPSANEVRAWLWDGNDRLLTCQLVNSQCTAPNFSLGGLGDYDPASGSITVNDRNRAGLVVTSHNATAFRDWVDSMGSAFIVRAGGANNPCSTEAPFCTSQHDGKLTADGWTLDNDTWQGVRTYDGTVGQWNSPDAYAGDVHDPMSQKPFMWNRNNPYTYADPTGFDPCSSSLAGCPGKTESSAWSLRSDTERGKQLEKEAGANLPYPFPGVDRSDPAPLGGGMPALGASTVVTSIKSLDTRAPSYQSTSGFFSKGKTYIDKLAGMPNGGWEYLGAAILMDSSTIRRLTLVVPKTANLTSSQEAALNLLNAYAAEKTTYLSMSKDDNARRYPFG